MTDTSEIIVDLAAGLEGELRQAEAEARAVLADHAGAAEEAAAGLDPDLQRVRRLAVKAFGAWGGLLEHGEPTRPRSRIKARPCRRCQAALDLLVCVGEVREALRNGAGEVAALHAMRVGHLRLRLSLRPLEDAAAIGAANRCGGVKGGAATNADRRARWAEWQRFVEAEVRHDGAASWPEIKRRTAQHFHVHVKSIARHCHDPRRG